MRSFFYFIARILGDITAISKGPKATAKRITRKFAWKGFSRTLRWF